MLKRRAKLGPMQGAVKRAYGIAVAGLLLSLVTTPSASADLRKAGNHLVDGPGKGKVVRLLGVNRSGLEYACFGGWGFFDSPHPHQIDTQAMVDAMKTWDINAVRVPLNEDCWLDINGIPAGYGGRPYWRIVHAYVRRLNDSGLYVILDLHVAAPGNHLSKAIVPMADADHAPHFWRSLASSFKHNHKVIFDLYNEPHGISWMCWLHGCHVPAGSADGVHYPAFQTTGMQQLVDAVRSTGARQPLMLGGTEWSRLLTRWVRHRPHDPLHGLVASEHNYGILAPCGEACKNAIVRTARHNPVVVGEFGQTDCRHDYIDRMMPFLDSHGVSYLGWTWDAVGPAPDSWKCDSGPSLIKDYAGTPTNFGIGLRDHLRALAGH
jgi:endoglucanase